MRTKRFALVAAALLFGCAHGRLTPPENGGPAWIRVSGPHLSLTTELARADAEREVRELEQLRTAMLEMAWGKSDAKLPRIEIVAFSSVHGLRAFASDETLSSISATRMRLTTVEGVHLEGVSREPLLVTHAESALVQTPAAFHTVAAFAAQAIVPPLPWWITEGTTWFLQSAELSGERLTVGDEDYNVLNSVHTSVASLLDPRVKHDTSERATAIALVYFLRASKPQGFLAMVHRLIAGVPEAGAVAAAFPGLSTEQLEQGVDFRFFKQPPTPVAAATLQPFSGELRVEALSPADVHALWAQIFFGRQADARGEEQRKIAEALEPGNVAAQLVRIQRMPQYDRLEPLRALIAKTPGDVRPCRLFLRTETLEEGERLACADRVIAAEPDDAIAHDSRAIALVRLERADEAAAEMLVLRDLTGPDLALLLSLAQLQAKKGQCAEAIANVEEGLRIGERAGANGAPLRLFLAQLKQRCDASAKPQ